MVIFIDELLYNVEVIRVGNVFKGDFKTGRLQSFEIFLRLLAKLGRVVLRDSDDDVTGSGRALELWQEVTRAVPQRHFLGHLQRLVHVGGQNGLQVVNAADEKRTFDLR